ncbi:hypothetical protein ACFQ9Q_31165 [Streptomyces virginiae]|uniref:hypothetical protein n=1 Tax=Streptomyces virginiae TaxID=1961 RepID=UPI0036B4B110
MPPKDLRGERSERMVGASGIGAAAAGGGGHEHAGAGEALGAGRPPVTARRCRVGQAVFDSDRQTHGRVVGRHSSPLGSVAGIG